MEKIFVQGGEKLYGTVKISGMKNSALPIIFSTILVKGESVLENIPIVSDVHNALSILSQMGATVKYEDLHTVRIKTENIDPNSLNMELISKMRASSYLMGTLLAVFGKVMMAYPGGCNFGQRPIDEHLKGFTKMGAKCKESDGYVEITTDKKLKNGKITLDKISVGATINMILASVLTEGKTIICNTAMEPHIDDTICFLNKCGANIKRVGNTIHIRGVDRLKGVRYSIFPDTIEALTYISCVGATKGVIELKNIRTEHLSSILPLFEYMGMDITDFGNDTLNIRSSIQLCGAHVRTAPYPGFPTDFHPQFSSLLCYTNGGGSVDETIFPGRFAYVNELKKMGGRVDKTNSQVFIMPSELIGTETCATDLRAGAALIVASLGAKGVSTVNNVGFILRGYEDIVGKLSSLGAIIKVI
ncbi:MAG: UDP-N-acetylglucosamine 1-carboxyvinyltransferase [Clostridia bacterium]|nr:UDP-N-acetylglucosamine 1-carboxyvinyltransferase [Clostridia bacterium]